MSDPDAEPACACENPEAGYSQFEASQLPGYDETNGRFGEVSFQRCRSCGRFWLRYFVEYEGFTASGRWGRGLIDESTIAQIKPDTALDYLHAIPWYLRGGSYWGKADRTSGPSDWDL